MNALARWRSNRSLARQLERCRHRQRMELLRALGVEAGEGAAIHAPFQLVNRKPKDLAGHLRLGRQVYVGPECLMDLKADVTLGDRVTLAYRVSLITHLDVGASKLKALYPPSAAPIVLEDDVFIGTGATVLAGVRIGAGSFVGAGSVVTRDVEPGVLVAGLPARVVRPLGPGEGVRA